MKKSGFFFVLLASFFGVLAALQADRLLPKPKEPALANDPVTLRVLDSIPASYPTGTTNAPADFRIAARKVLPSVVSVDRYDQIQRFMEDPQLAETGTGSGVIISSNGIIVTNNHVVADAVEVRVRLSDKRSFKAKVLGRDPRGDIAVLKIEATNLIPVEMGDSSKLEVGEWVIAVGNPLGYDQTVSVGVVSNKSRSLPSEGEGVLLNAIQTDAAINPGNSGGALTNAEGQLVGINSAIISTTGTSIGIGFAIPVNRVKEITSDIIKYGHSRAGSLGIKPDPRLDGFLDTEEGRQQIAEATNSTNVPTSGLVVPPDRRGYTRILSSGAAARAGVRQLDVIEAIDDNPITDSLSLSQALVDKKAGDKVKLKFWSQGQTKTITLTLSEEPQQA